MRESPGIDIGRRRRGKLLICRIAVNLSGKRTVSGHNSEKLCYTAPKEQYSYWSGISQVIKQRKMAKVFCCFPLFLFRGWEVCKIMQIEVFGSHRE